MTIDLPIQQYNGWRVVKAEIVSIAEWMPASFAVHRNPYTWESAKWCVSNIETGARCGSGATRIDAIKSARRRASTISRRRFFKNLKKVCNDRPQVLDTSVIASPMAHRHRGLLTVARRLNAVSKALVKVAAGFAKHSRFVPPAGFYLSLARSLCRRPSTTRVPK